MLSQKFVDDLTTLEFVIFFTVCMIYYNVKAPVPNDLLEHNRNISADNLKSQNNLDSISDWTMRQKIWGNHMKKSMFYNFHK